MMNFFVLKYLCRHVFIVLVHTCKSGIAGPYDYQTVFQTGCSILYTRGRGGASIPPHPQWPFQYLSSVNSNSHVVGMRIWSFDLGFHSPDA